MVGHVAVVQARDPTPKGRPSPFPGVTDGRFRRRRAPTFLFFAARTDRCRTAIAQRSRSQRLNRKVRADLVDGHLCHELPTEKVDNLHAVADPE